MDKIANQSKKKKAPTAPVANTKEDYFGWRWVESGPGAWTKKQHKEADRRASQVEKEWEQNKYEQELAMADDMAKKEKEQCERDGEEDRDIKRRIFGNDDDVSPQEMDDIIEHEEAQIQKDETPAEKLARWNREDAELDRAIRESAKQIAHNSSHHDTTSTPPSKGKTLVASIPVTNEKESPRKYNGSDGSSCDSNETDQKCNMCSIKKALCHRKLFSLYAIDAVDDQFRYSPLDNSCKKYTQVYTIAYNRALDFKMFEETLSLIPQGFYYPPPCMIQEFCEFMTVIEKDKNDYILGKTAFQQDVEPKHLKDIEDNDDEDKLLDCTQVCRDCGKPPYKCHHQLFSEYCYSHLF